MGREGGIPAPVGPQIIFGFDSRGYCTILIGPGLERLGLEPSQLVGQDLFEVYRDAPDTVAWLRRALTGETFAIEQERDGHQLWTYFQPMRDSDGFLVGALGVTTETTDQRRADIEARGALERATRLADLSSSLTREVLNLESLLQIAVRTVTEMVPEFGVIWLRTPNGDQLEPRAVWHVDESVRTLVQEAAADAQGLHGWLDASTAEKLGAPRVVDWTEVEELGVTDRELAARSAKQFGLHSVLRLPLRSRGRTVGMIDVARGSRWGAFTESDIALAADITERCALAVDNALLLAAEREAREDLLKYRALADAAPDLIAISDNDGCATYVNPRVNEAGIDWSQDLWDTVATYAGESTMAQMRGAVVSGGSWSGELLLQASGASVVRADVFPLTHPETGAGLGMAWIAQDITELRRKESALRAANSELKQFQALVEGSSDFIAIADMDGAIRYVNPAGRELVGLDPAIDVTTTTIADYLSPEGLEASLEVEQATVLADGHWEGESSLRDHRGGPDIPVAQATFVVRDLDTGEPFALATIQRDITERLAAEDALRELAEQRQALLTRLVEAQDAERAQIAADVHDDSVQALAAVDLRVGLLRRQLSEHAPELLDTLGSVQDSVTRATERLRALLFDLEPPDPHEGLSAALRRAAAEIFDGTQVTWEVRGDKVPDISDVTRAVAYRITREAMINARKHAHARKVTVTVSARSGGLEVMVIDDGVGLGPGAISSSPGHRGLVSMRDRAAIAGGRVDVVSDPGGGLVVTLWLPGSPAAG